MAPKSSRKRPGKQSRKSGINRPSRAEIRAAKSRIKAHDKALAKHARERARAVRDYEKLLDLGLYKPRRKPRRRDNKPILTKGQRRYITRRAKRLREYLEDFIPVKPRGKPERKKAILKEAKRSGLNVRGNAVFVARSAGGGNLKSARIVMEDGRPVLKEIRTHEKSTIPFATVDELIEQKEKLRRQFNRAGSRLKKGEHVRFYIEGKYGSNAVFGASPEEFDRMYSVLSEYRSNQAQLYAFIARLRIGVQTKGRPRNRVVTSRDRVARQRRKEGSK